MFSNCSFHPQGVQYDENTYKNAANIKKLALTALILILQLYMSNVDYFASKEIYILIAFNT